MDNVEFKHIFIMIVAFITALTLHEYSHGRAALAAGDDTAKRAGRLTLNPLAHLDPVGSIFFLIMMMSGFGIGWAKPVPVNPANFKSPRWDNLKVSLWGPLSNILFAIALSILYRTVIRPFLPDFTDLVLWCVAINIMLALFNILPIPPLDGSHILSSLLPTEAARSFEYVISKYGMTILLVIIVLDRVTGISVLGILLGRPVNMLFALLTGRILS